MSATKEAEATTQEDCPICLHPLCKSDLVYPLLCPTPTCSFQCCCAACLQSMLTSSLDEYQEASDGSRQVKVKLACPQCRSPYEATSNNNNKNSSLSASQQAGAMAATILNNNNNGNKPTKTTTTTTSTKKKKKSSPQTIVEAVLLLRRAHVFLTSLATTPDSNLSATQLQQKQSFTLTTKLQDLQDAYQCVQTYQNEIIAAAGGTSKQEHLPELDWTALEEILTKNNNNNSDRRQQQQAASSSSSSSLIPTQHVADPSLFAGLQDLLTEDEQVFLTQLLVSGLPILLAQAAMILHGVLHNVRTGMAQDAVQQMANFSSTTTTTTTTRRGPKVDVHKIRKRYPLPRMPLCVQLPLEKTSLLKFCSSKKKNASSELQLASVRGGLGKAGLRVADVVTHVNEEPVANREELDQVLLHFQSSSSSSSSDYISIVVNATDETAKALKERAQKIQRDKVYG